ncbi:hypothetical protein BGX20_001386 [Mortierella sp. AD010]|nr:hypothetical protein BGX20_001386 [Mortierella sp. AD010]
MLHRKLLESEVKSDLKGKFCNTGFVDDPYEDVNEGTVYVVFDAIELPQMREPVVGVVPNSVTAQTSSQKTSPPKPLSEMLSLAEKPSSKKPEEQHKALSPQMKSRKTAKESSKTHNAGKRGDRELLLHLRENMKKGDLRYLNKSDLTRYERLDKSKFSTLSSEYWQKCGECPIRSKIRSYAIDFDCPVTRSLFTDQEWNEISHHNQFELPVLPTTTVIYLLNLQEAMLSREPLINVLMPSEGIDECELIPDTFRSWQRMYRKTSSAFATNDLSEAYWGRNSWPILMTLMDDIPNIFMIDGEKFGLESPRRRNHGRQLIQDLTTAKKKDGQEV